MMRQITPYLNFSGRAREALEYYKEIFKGEIIGIQTFGEADFPTPVEADDRIMHAQFKKDDLFFMVSDTFPGNSVEIGNHISLTIDFENEAEIQNVYKRLSQKGTILMELQDTFWGAKFAKVQDPFGMIWDLNYTKS
ncbi:VOC family protein [Bacillus cihuensis]|uniref:VOC family protein n=1 Tax=Bacillus cihuensis TaxID=1208599 RepID=UPI0004222E36|nr:VOC family protein [Bacillus cihuensis]